MGRRVWNEEEERKLTDMWNNGVPIKEIAKEFGLKKSTISARAAILNLTKRSKRVSSNELVKLEELYIQGKTDKEISNLLNLHRSTIERYKKKLNLEEKYRRKHYNELTKRYFSHLKKYNKYDLETYDYGILWTSNTNKAVLFDKEDYELIKDYCWYEHKCDENKDGYIEARTIDDSNKIIKLHRLVTGVNGFDIKVDHKKHKLWDNRKSELRICTNQENTMNRASPRNNTSGVTGVNYDKGKDKWRVRLYHNNESIHLGYYDTFEEAVLIRNEAVEKYRGEWSYENSMKNIEVIA